MDPIELLTAEVARSGLLTAPRSEDGIVFGTAHLRAAGADVTVNLDPELEDRPGVDIPVLLAAVERVLTLSDSSWQGILDEVAEEIEEAVGDQEVSEASDLRDDLALVSVVAFHDAVLLSFAASRQFPDSWIRVQLDEELAVEDVAVDEKDDVEVVEFGSLDALLDHISADEGR